jgi:hypothetical protein
MVKRYAFYRRDNMEQLLMLVVWVDMGLIIALIATIWLLWSDRKKTPPEQPPKPHKPLFKPKEPKETEEEKRLRILSENIENYDGSAKGQIKL